MLASLVSAYAPFIALGIMLLTFIGFAFERYPPEVTAAAGASAFLLLGFVTPAETFGVFANPAPLTIAAMFVMTGALVHTGVLERAVGAILDFAGSRPAFAIGGLAACILLVGGFINNTPLVLILIPMAVRIARRFEIASTLLLIPVSYLTILAGTLTLIGTSTNLLVDGVARESGLEPFSIFEITPVGIVTALSGLALLLVSGRALLPNRPDEGTAMDGGEVTFLSELSVTDASDLGKDALGSLKLFKLPNLRILGLKRGGDVLRKETDAQTLRKGDRLIVTATASELLTLAESRHLAVGLPAAAAAGEDRAVVEAVLAPQQTIVGRRIDELAIGSRFGVRIVGIHRHNHTAGKDLRSSRLRAADRLLLEGPPSGLDALSQQGILVSVDRTSGRAYRRSKAPIAVAALLGVVALAAMGVFDIGLLAMLGVVAILLLRCIDSKEAWGAIDGGILVLIFSMLIIGLGLQRAGALELIVTTLAPYLAGLSPFMLLVAVYLLASTLTEIITNNAVAVVMTPIVIGLGVELGVDPRPLVVAVMFAASASFATPIGYQTNTLVYGAGNYRFTDFAWIGIPMNIVVGIATCAAIYIYYGL